MENSRSVAILAGLFIPDSHRMTYSGADRYLVNLYQLLEELGYRPCVWQAGEYDHDFAGMKIRALPCGDGGPDGIIELNLSFFERTTDYSKAIYYAPQLAFPRVKRHSIVISHGVFWDYPGHPLSMMSLLQKEEWLRRLRYAFTAPDLLVSVDTNTLNWIRATWPGYENKQMYVPNFVDTEQFHPVRKDDSKVTILYPRRLTWIRGIDDVKVVAERITRRHDFVEFHFVGRGHDDSTEGAMRQWANANPRCKYYWVPFDEMPRVYQQADIVLIPTHAAEGTSLSCLEAMACGKAVICCWVGGLTDLVTHGQDGILCPMTPDALEAAIEELILHPEQRQLLGTSARRTAESFSLFRWKTNWTQALKRIWGGKPHEAY
jgi:glycosyltransferase involved in cell wall biosynthesis